MFDPLVIVALAFGTFLLMILGALVFVYYSNKKDQEHELAMRKAGLMDGASGSVAKETIIKEVVMIPCPYCGGLMDQTATFCSNCGARRKA